MCYVPITEALLDPITLLASVVKLLGNRAAVSCKGTEKKLYIGDEFGLRDVARDLDLELDLANILSDGIAGRVQSSASLFQRQQRSLHAVGRLASLVRDPNDARVQRTQRVVQTQTVLRTEDSREIASRGIENGSGNVSRNNRLDSQGIIHSIVHLS